MSKPSAGKLKRHWDNEKDNWTGDHNRGPHDGVAQGNRM